MDICRTFHIFRYFSHRILSRDECFDNKSKTANLSSLFPCGDHMVCIIDDREDVWNYAPNLVHVKPYIFFKVCRLFFGRFSAIKTKSTWQNLEFFGEKA